MITEVERLLKQILRRTDIGSHDTTEDLMRDLRHIEQHARDALAALQGGERGGEAPRLQQIGEYSKWVYPE